MASLDVRGLTKRFGRMAAVDRVDLSVRDREFVALLGPSGCGKTTLLRLFAGFEVPDEGELALEGVTVSRAGWALPPEDRRIGMVFQSYALWPHMSVAENVGFSLRVRGMAAEERRKRVAEALDLVGLADFASRRPAQLSGGQRQRVALARCMAMRPALVLLDEPLANLDPHLREAMQSEFRRLHREIGATFVYVTHDQAEAMALADRIVVMDRGRIEQIGEPQQIYREPGPRWSGASSAAASSSARRFRGRTMGQTSRRRSVPASGREAKPPQASDAGFASGRPISVSPTGPTAFVLASPWPDTREPIPP